MKKQSSILGIFYRAFILTVFFIAAVGVLSITLIEKSLRQTLEDNYVVQQSSTAKQTGLDLKSRVQASKDKLTYVAEIDSIKSLDKQTCNAKVDELIQTFGLSQGNLARINSQGIFYCSHNRAIIGLPGSSFGSYIPQIFNDPVHMPVMGRMIMPKGADGYVMGIHVPVYNNKREFVGTLGGAISVKKLATDYLRDIKIGQTGFVSVFDDNGDVIYNINANLIGKNRYGEEIQKLSGYNQKLNQAFEQAKQGQISQVRYKIGGEDRIAVVEGVEVLPGRHWIIYGVVPYAEIADNALSQGAHKALTTLSGFYAFAILMAALYLFVVMRLRIFKPIKNLDIITKKTALGDLSVRSTYKRNDELGRLGQSFNLMLDKVKNYNSNLRQEVDDKTKQLKASFDELEAKNAILEDSKRAVLNILEDLNDEKADVETAKAKDEAILASIGDGVFAIDTDKNVLLFNQAAEEITGFKASEVIGKKYSDVLRFVNKLDNKPYTDFIDQALSGKSVKMVENTSVIHKDKHQVPVADSAAPIRDASKKLIGAIIVFRDVTKEQEATEKLLAIVSNASDAIISADNGGNIISFNQGAEKMFGYSETFMLGKSLQTIMPERFREQHNTGIKRAAGGGAKHVIGKGAVELAGLRKDGVEFPLELTLGQWEVGGKQYFTAIMRDVTARKELDNAKDEFVSIASHELRTPATAVKNFIGLLKEGYAGDLSPEQKEYIDYAYDSNERQLEIINSLLYVARSDAGRINLTKLPTLINELIQSNIVEQQQAIDQREQKITFNKLPKDMKVALDPEYFKMAVTNFISNASKYTPEKGRIAITIRKNKSNITIDFSDSGVGIAKKDFGLLFKKFSRIDNELSTRVGGNGLGLYLTRQIIDLHGGQVDVQSEVGKGSTFTITIPLEEKDD